MVYTAFYVQMWGMRCQTKRFFYLSDKVRQFHFCLLLCHIWFDFRVRVIDNGQKHVLFMREMKKPTWKFQQVWALLVLWPSCADPYMIFFKKGQKKMVGCLISTNIKSLRYWNTMHCSIATFNQDYWLLTWLENYFPETVHAYTQQWQ